jgi:UDP-GlcNAc:undecaprenyl-phosphate GlcNAc-1-phosphate transferase
MLSNLFLLIFALAFLGCVLATPVVTKLAAWAGAIDRPDQFRRIHKGAIPRLGGLGLACGLALATLPLAAGWSGGEWERITAWWSNQGPVIAAVVIVLVLGAIDDTTGVKPRPKLLGQALAALVLIAGGIRIKGVAILGMPINLSYPIPLDLLGYSVVLDLPSVLVTLVWFLACMNIWNLIDGMDGLASGVGLLVSGTLMLVALRQENDGSAALAAALAGSLAGFLLYNWHPACIFLGDSGSLLIGLLIGVIGVEDSMKGTATVSILFPILAMGVPISDTAMAIFRRWVRNLPLSAADRQHVHHLLLGLGLTPRQAAFYLYAFCAFMCGVVLLGVALNNPVRGEFLALLLGGSGCLAFLLILTSRRDELASLRADLESRFARKRQEKLAARLTWEAIQKVELCREPEAIGNVLETAADALGCDRLRLACYRDGRAVLLRAAGPEVIGESEGASGPAARFRLTTGQDLELTVAFDQAAESTLEADIALRSLQRLALAAAERVEQLLSETAHQPEPGPQEVRADDERKAGWWVRWALGRE